MKLAYHCGLPVLASLFLGALPIEAQSPAENAAAFAGSSALTRLSFHWDTMADGHPVIATSPRSTLPFAASLTSINYDPLNPALYQEKVIGGQSQPSVLVGTFTNPNNFWNQPGGTELTLTYTVNSTTHYIFPYVTVGQDLHTYLRSHYFPSGSATDDEVALRIDQALGLDPSITLTTRGLAFFWVPITQVVRSGYQPDVSQPVTNLTPFSDGSYQPMEAGVPAGFRYVDIADNTITYSTNPEFVSFNQAQTHYPWTAMGYTFNWNSLQNGSNPAYGNDPLAPASFIGISEFMVSGGSQVLLESWVPFSDFDVWIIPEPGTWILILLGWAVLPISRRFFPSR